MQALPASVQSGMFDKIFRNKTVTNSESTVWKSKSTHAGARRQWRSACLTQGASATGLQPELLRIQQAILDNAAHPPDGHIDHDVRPNQLLQSLQPQPQL